MLKGIDISHWNSASAITKELDFVICKATEGNTYKDKTFLANLEKCSKLGIECVGAYHFAKTNQNVQDNVDNFVNTVMKAKQFGKSMILALDIEGIDITRKNAFQWCLDWLQLVELATGIKPVVYVSASYTKKMKEIASHGYGLWVAHWTKKPKPTFYNWKFWAFWQYGVVNKLDRDYFNGTKEQYIKYCLPK